MSIRDQLNIFMAHTQNGNLHIISVQKNEVGKDGRARNTTLFPHLGENYTGRIYLM